MGRRKLSNGNELKIGVALSYSQTLVSMLIGIIYTPIMLRILGKSEYGLYNTVASTISTLGILDFGFVSSYIKYYTKYKVNNEEDKINKLNGLFLTIYFVIGLVAFACGIFLSNHLTLVFDKGLDDQEKVKARVMLIMLSVNMFISFFSTAFKSYINAHEKFVFMKTVGLLQTVVNPLIRLPIILAGYGSVGMTVANFAINIFVTFVFIGFAIKKLRFKASFGNWEKGLFRSMLAFSSLIAVNILVDQVNGKIDNIIIARYCGTAEVAVYAVGAALCSYFSSFSWQIYNVFIPRVNRIIVETKNNLEKQKERITGLFIKVGRIQFLILALVASGLVFFGKSFIYVWAGEGYEDAYWVVLWRVIPGLIPLIQNIGTEAQRAQYKHYYRTVILGLGAVLNLALTIVLCKYWTSVGAAIGTGISTFIGNGIIMNIVYQKKININILEFWKNILKQLFGMIIPFCVGTAIMLFAEMNSYLKLIPWIAVYTVVYLICIWFFSTNESEKSLIKNFVNRLCNMIKKKA